MSAFRNALISSSLSIRARFLGTTPTNQPPGRACGTPSARRDEIAKFLSSSVRQGQANVLSNIGAQRRTMRIRLITTFRIKLSLFVNCELYKKWKVNGDLNLIFSTRENFEILLSQLRALSKFIVFDKYALCILGFPILRDLGPFIIPRNVLDALRALCKHRRYKRRV